MMVSMHCYELNSNNTNNVVHNWPSQVVCHKYDDLHLHYDAITPVIES